MIRLTPKALMFIFGFASIAGVAVFLMFYQGSPGPLSTPHAEVIRGSTIFSCRKCHADKGLTAGCLHCHAEIAGQLEGDTGYHAFILKDQPVDCEQCHAEHMGADFPLVNAVSWQDTDTNSFNHPHVEFTLTGRHDQLTCEKCHDEKLQQPFALEKFEDHVREHTMLGLNQECASCHMDVHESGEKTRDCTQCHNQEAFKPAPFFDHSKYFVLEGLHAKAACSACHQTDAPPELMESGMGERVLKFGPVKGKQCADCHESPHRFEPQLQGDCLRCHKGADSTWTMGERGVDVQYHTQFGFELKGAHMKVECAKCHSPELETYAERFPDPASVGYTRKADQCSGCHKDPHDGQFKARYPSCAQCHTVDRFMPSNIGPGQHPASYPLLGAHRAIACIQCHTIDPQTDVRQFKNTPVSCKVCHADPHDRQFEKEILENDCTACHRSDFSTFKIESYVHQNMRAFFKGKGHANSGCVQCHAAAQGEQQIVQYRSTPTDCAACHQDLHRGQFSQNGQTQCERCHASTAQWTADQFSHERDSTFTLGTAHSKLDCKACHFPAPQRDGTTIVQYRPLTSKCEDCHGFQTK